MHYKGEGQSNSDQMKGHPKYIVKSLELADTKKIALAPVFWALPLQQTKQGKKQIVALCNIYRKCAPLENVCP